MAIVTRRYVNVGVAISANLARFVSASTTPTIAAQYAIPVIDINVDNTVTDLIEALDEFMATLGLTPSTMGRKQVFQYVATGAEANPFTVGSVQGLAARPNTTYCVQATHAHGAGNNIKALNVVAGSLTVSQFQVETSASLQAGDTLMFTVEDIQ